MAEKIRYAIFNCTEMDATFGSQTLPWRAGRSRSQRCPHRCPPIRSRERERDRTTGTAELQKLQCMQAHKRDTTRALAGPGSPSQALASTQQLKVGGDAGGAVGRATHGAARALL